MKKRNKRILKTGSVLSVAGIAAIGLTSCGSSLSYESSVQLIVSDNTSTLADKSFSENTYDGIRDFMEWCNGYELPDANGVNENNGLWKKPGNTENSRLVAYKNAVKNGSNVVVATGYTQQGALQKATSTDKKWSKWKNTFSETAFVFVDGSMETSYDDITSDPSNVASVAYRADDGSFLAGIATAVFLNEYQDYFKVGINANNDMLGVSSFVGLALPSTLSYMNGFRMGIHYWNTVLQPLITTVDGTTETMKITWVDPEGSDSPSIDKYVTGDFSAGNAKANTFSKDVRSNGANAIFPIAGPQTSDVSSEIASDNDTGDSLARSIVLGVDTAQEDDTSFKTQLSGVSDDDPVGNNQILQFSSIKNLKHSTSGILKAIVNGQNDSSATGYDATNDKVNSSAGEAEDTWYGMGWNNVGTLNNGSVGVSEAGWKYLIDPYFWVSADNVTSSSLSTWSNTYLSYGSVTLNDLIGDSTYSVQDLSSSDPVVGKYANLLDGTIVTPTSVTADDTSVSLGVASDSDSSFGENGLNGALGNGSWEIYNNDTTNKVNTFLTISLSSYLPGISSTPSSDATYAVADNTPSYVATTATDITITKDDIHYEEK